MMTPTDEISNRQNQNTESFNADNEKKWALLPAFAPNSKRLEKNRIVTQKDRREAVYFDQLRTRILRKMREQGWKRLGITSPSTGCGKTTTAVNLALSFARNPETRVVLLDLDLRRPNVANLIGYQGDNQFSDVLSGKSSYGESLLKLNENLAIGSNSRITANPSELLQASGTAQAIDEIERDLAPDLLITDLPPLFATDDVASFAHCLDAVLIIAAAEHSTVNEIDRCERELAEMTNVLGVVLNKCRYMGKEYGYAYYN